MGAGGRKMYLVEVGGDNKVNNEDVDDCTCPSTDPYYIPWCGVNGKTYSNYCELECDGVEMECAQECPCPEYPDEQVDNGEDGKDYGGGSGGGVGGDSPPPIGGGGGGCW